MKLELPKIPKDFNDSVTIKEYIEFENNYDFYKNNIKSFRKRYVMSHLKNLFNMIDVLGDDIKKYSFQYGFNIDIKWNYNLSRPELDKRLNIYNFQEIEKIFKENNLMYDSVLLLDPVLKKIHIISFDPKTNNKLSNTFKIKHYKFKNNKEEYYFKYLQDFEIVLNYDKSSLILIMYWGCLYYDYYDTRSHYNLSKITSYKINFNFSLKENKLLNIQLPEIR
jgi:hypothetical protein